MTTRPPTHVVVDGSNIATEGRSMPSLSQLNDAVLAFRAEHPEARITVVVDATFGHRIPKSEVDEFDAAVANNELVAPPAGAVGRGDAFVLGIAHKANATVLSNDSFQEFHGQYEWLFDEGRLIGGKPVPHVGWVFVDRIPVRGPVSRKAVRDSKRGATSGDGRRRARTRAAVAETAVDAHPKRASREASRPMPVPTTPPPGRAVAGDGVNDLMPFLEFVERHPVGTSVNAIVDSYSSHGAYVRVGDVKGYVPLRLMGEPPPRSAREVMKVGDAVTLVVASFAPARRSIDLSMPNVTVPEPDAGEDVAAEALVDAVVPSRRGRGRGRVEGEPVPTATATVEAGVATAEVRPGEPSAQPSRRGRRKSAAASREDVTAASTATADVAPEQPAAKKAAAKKRSATTAAPKKAPAKNTTAKKTPAKKTPAKKTPARTAAAVTSTGKKAAAKQQAAPGDERAATAAPDADVPAKKTASRKTAAARSAAAEEKAPTTPTAKKASATKATAKKADGARKKAPSARPAKETARRSEPQG